MKDIEIARFEINTNMEQDLENLLNGKAKNFELLTSFGPVSFSGKLYVFFVFQRIKPGAG